VPTCAQDRAPVEPASLPAPDQEVEPVKPAVEKLDGSRYRIADVEFDQKTREVRFPAKVNMKTGLLEFLLVHQNGKIHESLLVTDTSALNINLALKLLRYQPSREFYYIPSDRGGLSPDFYREPEEVRTAARIRIDVEWEDGGRLRRIPAHEWVMHDVRGGAMPAGPWVYGGSAFHNGKFVPETTGSYIAIFLSNDALINYPGEDNMDDTVWSPFTARVPDEGTNVTVIIAPHTDQPSPAKP
jgi:hypothetical protein